MALLFWAVACSSWLFSASDAFRQPSRRHKPVWATGQTTPVGPPPDPNDEPIDNETDETEVSHYGDRPRTVATSCPQPTGTLGAVGELGDVDWLYTFGAPGAGMPGLQHATNEDGVFPGLRTWQVTENGWVDLVPLVTALAGAWHPWMAGEEIADEAAPISHQMTISGQDLTHWPYTIWGSVSLHRRQGYEAVTHQRPGCEEWKTFMQWATNLAYFRPSQLDGALDYAAARGWNLVGWGHYDGTDGLIGGSQESYLIQKPDTLECVVTFQGSRERQDWFANLAYTPTSFCGYTDADEWCFGHGSLCRPRHPRGSFVHNGFVTNIRNIVRTESWQQGVRAHLGKCSAVYVTGHSLGGTAGSLFSACVSKKLQPGDFGYKKDYQYMHWTRGQPELIDTIPVN